MWTQQAFPFYFFYFFVNTFDPQSGPCVVWSMLTTYFCFEFYKYDFFTRLFLFAWPVGNVRTRRTRHIELARQTRTIFLERGARTKNWQHRTSACGNLCRAKTFKRPYGTFNHRQALRDTTRFITISSWIANYTWYRGRIKTFCTSTGPNILILMGAKVTSSPHLVPPLRVYET